MTGTYWNYLDRTLRNAKAVPGGVFAALAGVGEATQAVQGDGQGAVRLTESPRNLHGIPGRNGEEKAGNF